MTKKIFLTGASGFIAQHIVKLLIEKSYVVVGTVRNEQKGEALKKNLNSENFHYTIVPDIAADNAFDKALSSNSDVSILLHTASPFFYDTTDPEKELIEPAVRGTKNIFNAIKKYGKSLERVVITSSDAAVYSAKDERNSTLSFDESSWNNITLEEAVKDPISAYYGSKAFAEKYAWEYMKANSPKFELTAVNPVYVFGPQAFESEVRATLNVSNELINSLIKLRSNDYFENDLGGFIDVRDVAKAHLAAFESDSTIEKRLLLTEGQFSTQMMLDVLNKYYPQLNLPKGKPGTGDQDIKSLATVDNKRTRAILKFKFITLDKILTDTVDQILKK